MTSAYRMTDERFGEDTFTLIDGGHLIYTEEEFHEFLRLLTEADEESGENTYVNINRFEDGTYHITL